MARASLSRAPATAISRSTSCAQTAPTRRGSRAGRATTSSRAGSSPPTSPPPNGLRPAVRGQQAVPGLVDAQEDADPRRPARQVLRGQEDLPRLRPELERFHVHPLAELRQALE